MEGSIKKRTKETCKREKQSKTEDSKRMKETSKNEKEPKSEDRKKTKKPSETGPQTSYSFSSQSSFQSIFAKVQNTLTSQSEEDEDVLLSKYSDDPIVKKSLKDVKKKKDKSPGKSPPKFPTTSSANLFPQYSSLVSKTNGNSVLDAVVTPVQLEVADLDTDTEIDSNEIIAVAETRSKKGIGRPKKAPSRTTRSRNKPKPKPIEIPDEDPESLNDEFTKFMAYTRGLDIPATPPRPNSEILEVSVPSTSSPIAVEYIMDSSLNTTFDDVSIRVSFRGRIIRFDGEKSWDVGRVRQVFSEKVNLPEYEIVLYNQDEDKLINGKTLSYYKYETGDILDAMHQHLEKPKSTECSSDGITLKFQKSGLKKPILLTVSKNMTLTGICVLLARELNVDDPKSLELHFDGDILNLTETPDTLELEDDYCIDVYDVK